MNFLGTQKRVRISHGEIAIGVRAIEIRLYIPFMGQKKWPLKTVICLIQVASKADLTTVLN